MEKYEGSMNFDLNGARFVMSIELGMESTI